MKKYISLRGVRQNNLKNINIDLPRNELTVITGVSGSGKSSLAFETLFAEGQRRYMESLSAYARQFLEQLDKPEADSITGIPPAVAIEQKAPPKTSRSTVGTITEINDYLRLLFARIGKIFCPSCSRTVEKETPEQISAKVLALPENTEIYITFPYYLNKEKSSEEEISLLLSKGYIRILSDKGPVRLKNINPSDFSESDKVYILMDRLKVSEDIKGRLVESIEGAFREGKGKVEVNIKDGETLRFSSGLSCSYCEKAFLKPSPLLFSFNSPYGACRNCQGFGNLIEFSPKLVIPDEEKTIKEGAVVPWTTKKGKRFLRRVKTASELYDIPLDVPYKDLDKRQKDIIWKGKGKFPGVLGFFEKVKEKQYKLHIRVFLSKYRDYTPCHKCDGKRLRPEALWVKIKEKDIGEICTMSVKSALSFFSSLKAELNDYEKSICKLILNEIIKRLEYLMNTGLDYITLDRLTKTISAGEYQRIKLASSLGSGLRNTLYVLDEPSIGLHPRDNERLTAILKRLRDLKNTVLVVEHDPEIILSADHIIDLGPGPGEEGGEVIFEGSPEELLRFNGKSLTSEYLRGEKKVSSAKKTFKYDLFSNFSESIFQHKSSIEIKGAGEHNLKNITLKVPLNLMVCVTGVSGSGKSTLVTEVLYPAIKRAKGDFSLPSAKYDLLKGEDFIEDVILVDQTPIGKTPRSNPVTYIKAFDYIRNLFSRVPQARVKNMKPGDFSFNVSGGRCDACEGNGYIQIDMQFMADLYVPCRECGGKRYKSRVLDIKYKGKNIHDVLSMTVREAISFFAETPALVKKLKVLLDTGLGYLRLGQSAPTLSGGEAQRLKLALYLSKRKKKGSLYIFDEPTTGLHLADIKKLLSCFCRLIEKGNSVLIIEHNLEVIKNADYIIDLGPEGGIRGGEIIFEGTPDEIIREEKSYTGKFLRDYIVD